MGRTLQDRHAESVPRKLRRAHDEVASATEASWYSSAMDDRYPTHPDDADRDSTVIAVPTDVVVTPTGD